MIPDRMLLMCGLVCLLPGALAGKRGHQATTESNEKLVKQLSETLSSVHKMLTDVHDKQGECYNKTGESNSTAEPFDINAVPQGQSGGGIVNVQVPYTYEKCLKDLNPKLVPPEKARIWCLRVVLWQVLNNLDAGDLTKGLEDAVLLQKTGSDKDNLHGRKKRGTLDIRRIAPANITRPLTGFRTRQEYRTLSVSQRNRFHAAMNELYQDGTVTCFALVHRNALVSGGAHRGNAFLPWHRAFLSLFEEALRQKDRSVSLPYWDSTLDNNMASGPAFSVMWDNAHLGTSRGVVGEGPFRGWTTAEGPLQRNVGRSLGGSTVRQSTIDTLLRRCRLDEFTSLWESAHDSVHVWVGATMSRTFAAADPVFYMHHAFIDYIWERFRQRQRSVCGINPATDYPPSGSSAHSANSRMVGMTFLINRDGIADYWINNWYNYADTPTCANNCGNSPDLYCNTNINLCVSDSRFNFRSAFSPPQGDLMMNSRANIDKDSGSYKTMIDEGKTPYTGKCSDDPYDESCPATPRPATEEEIVSSIALNEIQHPTPNQQNSPPNQQQPASNRKQSLPNLQNLAPTENVSPIQELYNKILLEIKKGERYPPESEEQWFHPRADMEGDCRGLDKLIRDPLVAYVQGKQLNGP